MVYIDGYYWFNDDECWLMTAYECCILMVDVDDVDDCDIDAQSINGCFDGYY